MSKPSTPDNHTLSLNCPSAVNLLLACRSPRWLSPIRHAGWLQEPTQVHFFPKITDLVTAASGLPHSLAIVELPPRDPVEFLLPLSRIVGGRGSHRWIGVGEPAQQAWRMQLLEMGAVELFCSVAEFGRLSRCFERHRATLPPLRIPWSQGMIQRWPWSESPFAADP